MARSGQASAPLQGAVDSTFLEHFMPTHSTIQRRVAALLGAIVLVSPAVQAADQWYFYVQNNSDSRIVKLQVSEDKKTWGDFDIGQGIAPGKKARLVWDPSTDDESCTQWMRARFADGSMSEAAKGDFCEDLDNPFVFE